MFSERVEGANDRNWELVTVLKCTLYERNLFIDSALRSADLQIIYALLDSLRIVAIVPWITRLIHLPSSIGLLNTGESAADHSESEFQIEGLVEKLFEFSNCNLLIIIKFFNPLSTAFCQEPIETLNWLRLIGNWKATIKKLELCCDEMILR